RHDVVADALEVGIHERVETIVRGLAEVAPVEKLGKGRRGLLDEKKRGGLERLDEALAEPDRKTVAIPVTRDPPDAHLQMPGRHIHLEQPEMLTQLPLRLIGVAVAAAVHVAVAIAVGERDLPGPAV